jgi:hypothetical protein
MDSRGEYTESGVLVFLSKNAVDISLTLGGIAMALLAISAFFFLVGNGRLDQPIRRKTHQELVAKDPD